jgi:hypothetical protein
LPLPAAPASPLDAAGQPLAGAYSGFVERVDWSAARHGRVWRALHGKRWHYVSIAGPRVVLACCIVDVGYASNAFGYVHDRALRALAVVFGVLGLPSSAKIADRAGEGAASSFKTRAVELRLERATGSKSWTLSGRGPDGFSVDATLDASTAATTLCAIAAIPGGLGNCTHKTVGLAARGTCSVKGARFDLDGHTAALDHTSGLMARETSWRWASAAGPRVGLNFVEDFNGPVENVVWLDGKIHPVGPVRFTFDKNATTKPWRLRSDDGAVDLTFTPESERRQHKNLGIAVSRYAQPIGTFKGRLCGTDVADLPGVTEDHFARW